MANYILKTSREKPHYIIYSTITDSPIAITKDREELIQYFLFRWGHDSKDAIERAVQAADELGTSSRFEGHGFDSNHDIRFQEGAPPRGSEAPGCWWIPRDKLDEWFVAAYEDDSGWSEANKLLVWKEWED